MLQIKYKKAYTTIRCTCHLAVYSRLSPQAGRIISHRIISHYMWVI